MIFPNMGFIKKQRKIGGEKKLEKGRKGERLRERVSERERNWERERNVRGRDGAKIESVRKRK